MSRLTGRFRLSRRRQSPEVRGSGRHLLDAEHGGAPRPGADLRDQIEASNAAATSPPHEGSESTEEADKCGAAPDLRVWGRPALAGCLSTSGTNGLDCHWFQRNA